MFKGKRQGAKGKNKGKRQRAKFKINHYRSSSWREKGHVIAKVN